MTPLGWRDPVTLDTALWVAMAIGALGLLAWGIGAWRSRRERADERARRSGL